MINLLSQRAAGANAFRIRKGNVSDPFEFCKPLDEIDAPAASLSCG